MKKESAMEKTTKEPIINKEDLEVIESIASNYNLTIQELGRILSRGSMSYPKIQAVFTTDEIILIDNRAKDKNISRSKYCSLCFKKAINEKLYLNMNLLDAVKNAEGGKRNHKVNISFSGNNEYLALKNAADDLGLKFSSLLRYFALNVEL